MKAAFRRIIGALLLGAVLAGCSAVKLGYNTLDDIAYWWLDGYADFSEAQAMGMREDIDRLHAWHRARELPRIAELLGRLEQMASGPVTAAQACALVPEAIARIYATWEQAEPAAEKLLAQMTPQQRAHIERKFADNNRKFRKDWADLGAAEMREKRFKLFEDRLEMVYGNLDAPQRAALRAGIDRSVYDPQRHLAERVRRQQDLLQVLGRYSGGQAPATEVRAALRGYIARVVQSPDPVYRAYQQAVQEEGCQMAAAVHESTTPAQRQQAVKRLRGYQKDLRELAAASSP
ncbi:MAG: hypothetical protein HY854_01975 [Burkholderiales bacterium]|nr:hypothetical protein [Burkholderiales bacterium]